MKLLKKVRNKIKNNNGESISEVLVALLISTLGLVMLATMITTSTKLVTRSEESMDQFVEAENALADLSAIVKTSENYERRVISSPLTISVGSTPYRVLNPSYYLDFYKYTVAGKEITAYEMVPVSPGGTP